MVRLEDLSHPGLRPVSDAQKIASAGADSLGPLVFGTMAGAHV
jgi:hypothetical protein